MNDCKMIHVTAMIQPIAMLQVTALRRRAAAGVAAARSATKSAALDLGLTDGEIAIILGLSPRTVEKHASHILHKLKVETRTAAACQCRLAQRDFPADRNRHDVVGGAPLAPSSLGEPNQACAGKPIVQELPVAIDQRPEDR